MSKIKTYITQETCIFHSILTKRNLMHSKQIKGWELIRFHIYLGFRIGLVHLRRYIRIGNMRFHYPLYKGGKFTCLVTTYRSSQWTLSCVNYLVTTVLNHSFTISVVMWDTCRNAHFHTTCKCRFAVWPLHTENRSQNDNSFIWWVQKP